MQSIPRKNRVVCPNNREQFRTEMNLAVILSIAHRAPSVTPLYQGHQSRPGGPTEPAEG